MASKPAEIAERVFHEYEQNNATVEILGHRVTVSFDVPFRRGERFIHPRMLAHDSVNLAPSVTIRLGHNDGPELKLSELHMGGMWYATSITQMSGPSEFLPDKGAVLAYWCKSNWEYLEGMLPSLRRFFEGDNASLQRLQQAAQSALSAELVSRKVKMSTDIINASKRIADFEQKLEMVQGGLL